MCHNLLSVSMRRRRLLRLEMYTKVLGFLLPLIKIRETCVKNLDARLSCLLHGLHGPHAKDMHRFKY